jgi:DNA-binding transcriptional MerR regulator
MRLKKHYSAREVAAFTGVSARQMRWWDAHGLVRPAIRSRRTAAGGFTERRYSPTEVFELLALAELERRGFAARAVRHALDSLQAQFGITTLYDAVWGGKITLLTNDSDMYARTVRGEYFNLLHAPGQPLLVVAEEQYLREVTGRRARRKRMKV